MSDILEESSSLSTSGLVIVTTRSSYLVMIYLPLLVPRRYFFEIFLPWRTSIEGPLLKDLSFNLGLIHILSYIQLWLYARLDSPGGHVKRLPHGPPKKTYCHTHKIHHIAFTFYHLKVGNNLFYISIITKDFNKEAQHLSLSSPYFCLKTPYICKSGPGHMILETCWVKSCCKPEDYICNLISETGRCQQSSAQVTILSDFHEILKL